MLEDYILPALKGSNILVKQLEREVGNSSFNIVPYTKLAALDIICGKYKVQFVDLLYFGNSALFILVSPRSRFNNGLSTEFTNQIKSAVCSCHRRVSGTY